MIQEEWNDRWLDEVRRKMDDYQEEVPTDGWDRILADIESMPAGNQSPSPQKHVVLPVWARAAAAMALLVIASGLWYFLGSHHVTQFAETIQPLSQQEERIQDKDILASDSSRVQQTMLAALSSHRGVAAKTTGVKDIALPDTSQISLSDKVEPVEEHVASRDSHQVHRVEPYHEDNAMKVVQHASLPAKRKHGLGWTLGMNVGGSAVSSSSGIKNSNDATPLPPHNPNIGGPDLDASPSIDSIPKNKETRGVNVPDRHYSKRMQGSNHKTWSFGVTLNKQLNDRWSFETGLVYTLLTSDVYPYSVSVPQKLHYLGIPLKMNFTMLQRKGWQLYAGTGTMVERCLYGTRGEAKLKINALQFSLSANAGIQYRLSQHTGLYLEPGIRYYFDDGTDVCSFRTEHPLSFTLQAGFRISY